MKTLIAAAALLLIATPALALKSCEELKSEIDAKLQAKGVKSYSLEIVPTDKAKDGKIVGSCEGGTQKIIYKREK
jgi:outer membrane lipoprotein-sorting protein